MTRTAWYASTRSAARSASAFNLSFEVQVQVELEAELQIIDSELEVAPLARPVAHWHCDGPGVTGTAS